MPKRRFFFFAFFLLLLCGQAGPRAGLAAQQIVGVVLPGDLPAYRSAHEAFLQILQAGGMADQAKIVVQTPNPDKMSLANSVRRLVGAGAGIVVTYGAPATLVAKTEAKKVPVLFIDVYDPVALDIVKTMDAPGVDLTGASSKVPLDPLLENLLRIKSVKSIGVLYSSKEESSVLQARDLEELAARSALSVLKQDAPGAEDIVPALGRLLGHVDAVFLTESLAVVQKAGEIVSLAAAKGVPTISQIPGLAEKGALLTLEGDPSEQGKLAAVHALQLLAGQKAFMLPVRTPKKIALVLNMRAAAQLSLKVPQTALDAAGRVIR